MKTSTMKDILTVYFYYTKLLQTARNKRDRKKKVGQAHFSLTNISLSVKVMCAQFPTGAEPLALEDFNVPDKLQCYYSLLTL